MKQSYKKPEIKVRTLESCHMIAESLPNNCKAESYDWEDESTTDSWFSSTSGARGESDLDLW